LYFWAAELSLLFLIATCASAQQSLGEAARQQRQAKKPAANKVYTNDDFAAAPAAAGEAVAAKTEKTDQTEKAEAAPKADDRAKKTEELKAKVDAQKKTITQLERELDLAQREYRLKVAVYYADAGNSLRDSKKWAEDDRRQRAEIESKKKALDDAKKKLADIQEQARKSGIRAE
jgi:hypothetical protein